MSANRLKTWQKATALVPLALLSGAWTTSLAVTTTASVAATTSTPAADQGMVPDAAIEAPASLTAPGSIAPGVPAGATRAVVASASTNGIPAAALAAYQRAAAVINNADPGCRVTWQLIAAIGRVESDHGRYGGNTLTDDGKSVPGIYGIPLDGSNGTARITDTDAGQYDRDPIFDRAVGPMQFIPSTWAVVGVDADGDGARDPQDIDDAAVATAVYLCSGSEDLSTVTGQRAAVYRYNHSQAYVDLVLSIAAAYLDGDYSSVPNATATSAVFTPLSPSSTVRAGKGSKQQRGDRRPGTRPSGGGSASQPGGGQGGSGGTGGGDGDGDGDGNDGVPTPPNPPADNPKGPVEKVTETVDKVKESVEKTVSALDQAKATCQSQFSSAEIAALGGLTACANAVLDKGVAGVQASLKGILDTVGDATKGILGN